MKLTPYEIYFHLSAADHVLAPDDRLSDLVIEHQSMEPRDAARLLLAVGRQFALDHINAINYGLDQLYGPLHVAGAAVSKHVKGAYDCLTRGDYSQRDRLRAHEYLTHALDLVATALDREFMKPDLGI